MATFNLSKTEFIAYLECPLKFYIIKSMNQGMVYGPRGERDYSEFPENSIDGMYLHTWFEMFHDKYFEDISNNKLAPKGRNPRETRIMKMFYKKELERYQQQPEFWHPLATEQYLESERIRGEIDRIDKLNDQGEYLLIEYKSKKSEFDEQELLFYACLINQIDGVIDERDFPIKITEIEVYYYLTGETFRRKILEAELTNFEKYLKSIKEEIFIPNWIRKEDCDMLNSKCKFKIVCKCIPENILISNESQKTVE